MMRNDFWSRRRARVAEEEAAESARARADAAAAQEAALAEKTDEELCAELGLPDPDTLGLGDDVRAFMSSAVPDRLRRRALRALWRTNPVLANLDGLVDHGEDFTDAAMVVPGMKTTYEVGKGLARHLEYLASKAEADDAQTAPAAVETAGVDDAISPENQDAAPASTTKVVVAEAGVEADSDPTDALPRPRRMTFSFTTETT